MKILVTGGAGYIGSFMTRQLLDAGHQVVVIDDLTHGHQDAVDKRAELVNADIGDLKTVSSLFDNHSFDSVMHFAGLISVAESVKEPERYIRINTEYAKTLLDIMAEHEVKRFIFSSTAAVYGNPEIIPIPEDHPKNPESPYGKSKLAVEEYLESINKTAGVKYVALRYFNASGASLDSFLGERHKNETHIIPLAIQAAINGTEFTLYGDDYDTPDGTCIRDYIHVEDLCHAHLLSLNYLTEGNQSNVFNVGTGTGYSNKQIVEKVEEISGKKLNVTMASRRPGDPVRLIADPTKIKKTLSWEPEHSSLHQIIQTAWDFHVKTESSQS